MVAPGYAGTGEPGMNYTSVNPMGVTMAPGSYYSGLPVTTYRSMYVTPGYVPANQTYYYTNSGGTYVPQRRRGLFGGLFGRRRQVYSTAPYGYTYGTAPVTYTYGTAPTTYTYVPAPY